MKNFHKHPAPRCGGDVEAETEAESGLMSNVN